MRQSYGEQLLQQINNMLTKKNSREQRSKANIHERSKTNIHQQIWIGQDTSDRQNYPETPPSNRTREKTNYQDTENKPIISKEIPHLIKQIPQGRSMAVGSKSPVQLMQDILRMVGEGQQNRVYYSRQAEQSLGELLTNRFKLTNYIKKLQSEMISLDSSVVKNYEMLVLLLNQLSGADVQVRQGEGGMEIKFNRGLIQRQEAEIERLQREKQEREKQMKYIVEEYESIIFNFNDVIEKLVNKEENRHKPKY